jgi:hypothetical protein
VKVGDGRRASGHQAPLDIDRAVRGGVEIVAACLNH